MEFLDLHKTFNAADTLNYLEDVIASGNLSAGGKYHELLKQWFYVNYNTPYSYSTSSCTDALEMSALLLDVKAGDEVIVPAYSFVSTANAFALRGCRLRFADCIKSTPNLSLETIEPLVTSKTKVIVVMHYAGIAVDMDPLLDYARIKNIAIVEDAAQAIGAKYKTKFLGTLGTTGCISFHNTKIFSCGEGGCCLVNDPRLNGMAEIIYEKGTDKSAFLKKETLHYDWQSPGSSFGMSGLQAAVLFAQLGQFDAQLQHRKKIWNLYISLLKEFENKELLSLPTTLPETEINGTHFYIVLPDENKRNALKLYLAENGVASASHYRCLHKSPYFKNRDRQNLLHSERYESCLLRLPIHSGIQEPHVLRICSLVYAFLKKEK